ncbi:membrane dipeptidase, partial [Stenotrophomonas nitritireducens]|uniref:membrane dipeptidase n=1 Tax=Stenotrophomonas nitritireducens TaxID=83617 RepID=UPI000B205FF3
RSRGVPGLYNRVPGRRATRDDFFVHFGHILDVVGPDHVGIGMDWDGGGGLPGMADITDLPKITAWLQRRGLSEAQIAAIWSGNVLRVMRQAQDYAAKNGAK